MKKLIILTGSIFALLCALLFTATPDRLSKVIVAVMTLAVFLGYIFGMLPTMMYSGGFKHGCRSVENVTSVSAKNTWLAVSQVKPFFNQKTLDQLFDGYLEKVEEQRQKGVVISDIEDVINEDALAVRSWRGVVLQISGTLTALGLLGTFLGLITGIGGVTFSTISDTIISIENLLEGITTAFYTSIVGVILSIAFNVTNRILWNIMLRQMQMFMESFHAVVQPVAEEQARVRQYMHTEEMLNVLGKIQDIGNRLANAQGVSESQEQRVMLEVFEGVKKGEFTFALQPCCKLADRSVTKAACLVRWNHEKLGTVRPSVYMPIVEANGYITKLHSAMWEDVCALIRRWYDAGCHPVPVSFPVTKTDMMVFEIPSYFSSLIERHGLAPRDVEVSLDIRCYIECGDEARDVEAELLKKGFRVCISGSDGSFLELGEVSADEVCIDLERIEEESSLPEIISQALASHRSVSAEHIDSAKQLAALRKYGCEGGMGAHLFGIMTAKEYEALMQY